MLTIIEDSRQQSGKHTAKAEYFEKQGIKVVRSKLPSGDYALLTDMSRVIDTKRNLQELVGNLIQDHERFRREADFCKDNGIELVVLIEEPGMKCLEDVRRWDNPRLRRWYAIKAMHRKGMGKNRRTSNRPPTSNENLYKIMKTFGEAHGCKWEFCEPEDAGRRVIELLTERKNIGGITEQTGEDHS